MAISRMGLVLSTGLITSSLLFGGCSGTTGPQGPAGATGPAGAPAQVAAVFTTASLNVRCVFDDVAEDAAARALIAVKAEALDADFNAISNVKSDWAVAVNTGTAAAPVYVATIADAPGGFDKITCRDMVTGDEMVSYVNLANAATDAPANPLVVDPISRTAWAAIIPILRHGGYQTNTSWTTAAMQGLEAAARADTDWQAEWVSSDLWASSPTDDLDTGKELAIRALIVGDGTILQAFAVAPRCYASTAPAQTFGVIAGASDGDQIDTTSGSTYANYTIDLSSGSDYPCALSGWAGAAALPVYSINGVVNSAVDGSANAASTDVNCSTFDGDGRVFGVVGSFPTTSAPTTIYSGNATMSWYGVRLYSGTSDQTAGVGHVPADAVYYGASLNCSADTTADCEMLGNTNANPPSFIRLDLPGAAQDVIFADNWSLWTAGTFGVESITSTATSFVTSATARASQGSSSALRVFKNCAPTSNTRFTYDPSTNTVQLNVLDNTLVAAEGVAANGHIGFVVADVNPSNTAQYQALWRLANQNSGSDPVSQMLWNVNVNVFSQTLLPYELAIMLATGNGLCDASVTQLSGDDFLIGAKTEAVPNVGLSGLPMGVNAAMSCGDDATSPTVFNRFVDENGQVSGRCPITAGAGQTVTVNAGTADVVTCTVQ